MKNGTDPYKQSYKKRMAKKKTTKKTMSDLAKRKTTKKASKLPLATKFKKLGRRGNID